ncbi:MAG: S41 family peptidase [Bacteroidota bacterium]
MNQQSPRRGISAIWLPLLFAITLAVGLYIGQYLQGSSTMISRSARSTDVSGSGRVEQLMRFVETKYVDEVDNDQLAEAAIRAVLDELDPHSTFIAAEEMIALMESMQGNFDGIGIEFLIVEDTITVVAPLVGGPSEAVGIQSGDQIIMIEDSLVAGPTAAGLDPASLLRGEKGTTVSIQVQRYGQDQLLPFSITRAPIPMNSVDAAYLLDDQTAYVKVNRFSATTGSEFKAALEELVERKGARDLVIDLRGNPGGYLREAVKMLNQLFEQRGLLLVYTEGRNSNREDHKSNGAAAYRLGQIVVLIDEGSASASEIVAGALQDHDRAIVVGRRSFGKGLVQEQYDLDGGAGLRLTIARYFTPSGRSIQRPYVDGEDDNYASDVNERYASGELTGQASVNLDSSQTFYTDSGHPVFGGGGINPDYFVALDTSFNDYSFLVARQQVPSYVFDYLDENRESLSSRYPNMEDFVARFQASDAVYRTILERAQAAIPADQEPLKAISGELRLDLLTFFKARLGRQLYGPDAFYAVQNESDPMVESALQLLRQPDPLAAARE